MEGTYVQRGFLPRWLATFFGIFFALALTFVMLWIAYKPQVKSGANPQVVEAGQHPRAQPLGVGGSTGGALRRGHDPEPVASQERRTRPVPVPAAVEDGGATATVTAKPKIGGDRGDRRKTLAAEDVGPAHLLPRLHRG